MSENIPPSSADDDVLSSGLRVVPRSGAILDLVQHAEWEVLLVVADRLTAAEVGRTRPDPVRAPAVRVLHSADIPVTPAPESAWQVRRSAVEPATSLAVVDRREAVLMLRRETGPGLQLLEHAAVDALAAHFDEAWARALRILAPTPATRQSTVLSCLAMGLTDEATAHRLSLTDRTVRRHIRDLMNRTRATSRFQLGMEAVRRGWIR